MTLSELLLPLIVLVAYLVFVAFLWRETTGTSWAGREPVRPRQPVPPRGAQERVLFVCTHNSARSQMAEALLRQAAPSRFVVASAGTAPTQLHPLAEQVMAERGLSLASHHAKSLDQVGTRWDYVITVCDDAYEKCPDFPAKTCRLHWGIKDPSGATTPPELPVEAFRRVRDDLSTRIDQWLADRSERP